jgi:ribose transport system substrate-binding protein
MRPVHGRIRPARLLALVLALCAACAIAGCGNKSSSSGAAGGSGTGTSAASVNGTSSSSSSPSSSSDPLAIHKSGPVSARLTSLKSVCGPKKAVVGLTWAFDGNGWRKLAHAMLDNYAKTCPSISKVLYANANLSASQSVSDINSLVAQGVNVLIVYPDFGSAVLPALQQAMSKGVKVVPFAVEAKALGGSYGVNYVDTVSENVFAEGETWGEWMTKALHGHGNVVFIGGTAGSPTAISEFNGIKAAFQKAPGMKILGDKINYGQYDVATTQQVMAGLLSHYGSQIDGVIDDYGGAAVGAIRAFQAANHPLVPFATADQNNLGCLWQSLHSSQPNFQLGTVSSRNWVILSALNKGMAAYEGKSDPEPSMFNLPIIEDSTGNMSKQTPRCVKSLPGDAILSAGVPVSEQKQILGGS